MKIQGMYVAAATPFDHHGALYRVKVQHNFQKWSRTSISGFVAGSLTGEGPLLDFDEKVELLRLAKQVIGERTLIADVAEEGVDRAVKLAAAAAEAGAHMVVSSAPRQYRNATPAAAQMLYFRALADRSPLPVLVHNAPFVTGADLGAETIAALAEHPNIVGAVETGTPASRVAQIRQMAPKEFAVLTGTEGQVWKSLQVGANGAVLAFASAAPYATIAIWEAFRTREEVAGLDWQERIARPSTLVTDLYGVPGLKHAMDLNGYYGGPPRLPLSPVSAEARGEIEDAFRDLRG